jgi:UDP-N-acetylmuramate: L-alanyl-gamma-D-glutamyl-meso-diaminopimelate ligase
LDVKKLVRDTVRNSKVINSFYSKNSDDIQKNLFKYISNFSHEKIIILAMSNGSFGGIYPHIIKHLENRKV